MKPCGTFQKLRPLNLLEQLADSRSTAHFKISNGLVSWSIYLEEGKIIYASHSVAPFDRLDCHVRRLSSLASQAPKPLGEIRMQLRQMESKFEAESNQVTSDYKAICWLVEQQHLSPTRAAILVEELVKEVIETFLLLKAGTYQFKKELLEFMPVFCRLEVQPILEYCQKQLQGWQALEPEVFSPYQRPYIASYASLQQLSSGVQQKLIAMLKGFSFRHLAVLLNKEELQLAQTLHPYLIGGSILLYDPLPPFDQLPNFKKIFTKTQPEVSWTKLVQSRVGLTGTTTKLHNSVNSPFDAFSKDKSTYTIVCVDDSPTMLNQLKLFLNDEIFSVVLINNPVKALIQIIQAKPDLILLDVKMAGIDGYELCRLVKNHQTFKSTPVFMVTGNTGIIDKIKSKMVGASEYLTKPFNQAELLKIMFKYLGLEKSYE